MRAAILLSNPKFPHNIGAVVRAASCYGAEAVRYTGDRMDRAIAALDRLPREERMRGYSEVTWRRSDRPFEEFPDLVPVAIEVRDNSVMLPDFVHPENALYVFGPEDGSLNSVTLRHCHHFVAIPTRHCLNLSMTVGTVLYDRQTKLEPGLRLDMAVTESRGWDPDRVFA